MNMLTVNENWNVWYEKISPTRIKYVVMNNELDYTQMIFINNKKRALDVCNALNKESVE